MNILNSAANTLNGRQLNAVQDLPDLRDRIYKPALLDLSLAISPPSTTTSPILDQKTEGACTGFALSSAINLQNNLRRHQSRTKSYSQVSARMLYEMAKQHDEWPDENYEGSSIRGAIKGFFHNGVCENSFAPFVDGEKNWRLTKKQAKNARSIGLGAYYRLCPEIIDYHAALNETGVIVVSANIHRGWQNPRKGIIKKSELHEGGHAFVIVGYNDNGFLIQNSWGPNWGGFDGNEGIAEWSYLDWAENVLDAWVLRLSVPTPNHFDLTHIPVSQAASAVFGQEAISSPKRSEILGHFIHLDDGKLVETGKYATTEQTIQETADLFARDEVSENPKYKHLLFYAHGGLNNTRASASRIKQMKEVYKRNSIYPIHFMWETGFSEEIGDILTGAFRKKEDRVGGIIDWSDFIIEKFAKLPGRAIWRETKRDAVRSFAANSGGAKAVKILLQGNAKRNKPMNVHFVGHSAGAILIAELLRAKSKNYKSLIAETVSLMAPACTIEYFENSYAPLIGNNSGIKSLLQYNLIDQRELDDNVGPYRKSLLYFISRAFEELHENNNPMPLLGMDKYSHELKLQKNHKIYYAGRDNKFTRSKSHGGFDNERTTMNNILLNITGKKVSSKKGFQQHELKGY